MLDELVHVRYSHRAGLAAEPPILEVALLVSVPERLAAAADSGVGLHDGHIVPRLSQHRGTNHSGDAAADHEHLFLFRAARRCRQLAGLQVLKVSLVDFIIFEPKQSVKIVVHTSF